MVLKNKHNLSMFEPEIKNSLSIFEPVVQNEYAYRKKTMYSIKSHHKLVPQEKVSNSVLF